MGSMPKAGARTAGAVACRVTSLESRSDLNVRYRPCVSAIGVVDSDFTGLVEGFARPMARGGFC